MVDFSSGGTRPVASTTSYARILYWHYGSQSFPQASSLRAETDQGSVFAVETGVIEGEIESVDVQKAIKQPAGSFSVSLLPTVNWRQKLAPGDWMVIFLYNSIESFDPTKNKNVAMLCNIDRVARVKEKDAKTDKTIVRYRVTGRDFGKVFDTDIFFNPYFNTTDGKGNSATVNNFLFNRGLAMQGGPSTLVSDLIDVFLSAGGTTITDPALGTGKTPPLNQWGMPKPVTKFFSGLDASFHGILKKDITASLPGFKPRSLITVGDNGSLWGYMTKNANLDANHLYCDLSRDPDTGAVEPTVFLKTIPTSSFFEDTPGQLKGSSKSLFELANTNFLEISSREIVYENMGRDGDYRINMSWMVPRLSDKSAAVNQLGNVKNIGNIGLPMQNIESIQRYGLKQHKGTFEFTYSSGAKETTLDITTFKSFINLDYDLNAYHHCYETGTIECSGKIDAQVGKCLIIKSDVKGLPDKIYFIEGYHHQWSFPGRWSTEFTLTMGQWRDRARPFIDLHEDDFGQFDSDFDNTSLVKTDVQRPGKTSLGSLKPGKGSV